MNRRKSLRCKELGQTRRGEFDATPYVVRGYVDFIIYLIVTQFSLPHFLQTGVIPLKGFHAPLGAST